MSWLASTRSNFDYSAQSPNHIEVFPLAIDTDRLRSQFERLVLPLDPVIRSQAIAGWSIQSHDGSYQSGFENSFLPNNGPDNLGPAWYARNPSEVGIHTMQDCSRPTSLCTEYLKEIVQTVEGLGLHPRRARIIRLRAGTKSLWHVDGQPSVYSVRMHIPIVTNRGCFFNYTDESFHMAADGNSYIVRVNRQHMIENSGQYDRYHLVMNIWDRSGCTRFHKYDPLSSGN